MTLFTLSGYLLAAATIIWTGYPVARKVYHVLTDKTKPEETKTKPEETPEKTVNNKKPVRQPVSEP
jgi:hypothetical protein